MIIPKQNMLIAKKKVCIICPEHGEFLQIPNYHLSGNGCTACGRKNIWDKRGRLTTEDFIKKAKHVHGDKYDYSQCKYLNKRSKVKIICHKKYKNGMEHGEFWQTPGSHINGNGCPHCRNSHLETFVHKKLMENNIVFEKEKTFDWLKKNGHLYLDFYLPEYNIGIECQGIQHYMPLYRGLKNNNSEFSFKKIKENDFFKKEECNKHGLKIFYFTDKCLYDKFKNNELFYNFDDLKNKVYECKT